MPRIEATECDVCGKLSKKGFTVSIESPSETFSYKGAICQNKLILTICKDCIKDVGGIFDGSLQRSA